MQQRHGSRYSHSYTAALPDFVAVAQAFGWTARRVSDPSDLPAALAECLASDGPFFLDIMVAEQANCFPMIASGCGHQEMMRDEDTLYIRLGPPLPCHRSNGARGSARVAPPTIVATRRVCVTPSPDWESSKGR